MSGLAILLVIISTFMHAGWNILVRRHRNERIFIRRLLGSVAIAGFVPFAVSLFFTDPIPFKAVLCVVGSGVFCGSYFYFLARSYESSDFTIAYPIARAMPVLLIAVGDVLRGRYLGLPAVGGLLLVSAGCFLVPIYDLRAIKLNHYFNKGTFFMLLTAIGTVGYSLLDKVGSEIIASGPVAALQYTYLFYLFTFVVYSRFPVGIKTHDNSIDKAFFPAIFAGLMSFGTYVLIVSAYQLTDHASLVVAFRQFSILIGVVGGLWLFRERGMVTRIIGALMLTMGLVIIGVFG